MSRFNKVIFILLALIFLISIAQASFASSIGINATDDGAVGVENYFLDGSIEINATDDGAVGVENYYFDSNAENDTGNGSIDNPYKYLVDARIKDNSAIHLANGEYDFTPIKSHTNISIYGQDSDKTIINGLGNRLSVSTNFVLRNITLVNTQINNNGVLNASHVNFINSTALPGSYRNSFGGAIYCPNKGCDVYLDGCTFENNYAEYGGAIYLSGGILEITDSTFISNVAYNYGGAIACISPGGNKSRVRIENSTFIKDVSLNDAGGAIYIKDYENLTINHADFYDSKATIGGSVCILNSNSYLYYINSVNNSAQYEGGSIYQIYGTIQLFASVFENNRARNGGAIFIDASYFDQVEYNCFINNSAEVCAGAFYSIINEESYYSNNTYINNSALAYDDLFNSSELNLFISGGNYTMYKYAPTFNGTLPRYYSLVDGGYLVPVKNQMDGGNCWAFAAIASLESAIIKATGSTIALSEENMKNIISFYSDYGWTLETNDGGYDRMGIGYLVSWLGPVFESDDLYDDHSQLSAILDSITHVQNIVYLKRDNFTDNDNIKKAIMDYGGVYTAIYVSAYKYGGNYVQYYTGTSLNHAVCIVGWDDDFYIPKAPDKGAWIVRNSWGDDWGNNGYFYISYYDTSCAQVDDDEAAYAFILNDSIKYDKNYQYDIAGRTDYFLNSSSTVWYKNRFVATDDEYLAGVSTYFEKDTNWTISVYVNDDLKLVKVGFSHPGYFTIDLGEYVPLKAGDVFDVEFKIDVDGRVAFPISESMSLNTKVYSENISFVSYDGIDWQDLYALEWTYPDHYYLSQVACIKAFTIFRQIETQTFIDLTAVDNYVNITAYVLNQYGNPVSGGKVRFNLSGEIFECEVSNGFAFMNYDFDFGNHSVSAEYYASGFISSKNSTSILISKVNVIISVDVKTYKDNAFVNITVSKPLNDEILVNNQTFRLVDGVCTYNLTDLDYGSHDIHVHLVSDLYTSNDTFANFTISYITTEIVASDFVTDYGSGDVIAVKLVDKWDNPLAERLMFYSIGNNSYMGITDSLGQIYIPTSLDVGVYDIDVGFKGNENYSDSQASMKLTVNKALLVIDDEISVNRDSAVIRVVLSKAINESIILTVDGADYLLVLKNGVVSLSLNDLDFGLHNVTFRLVSDSYEAENLDDNFIISLVKTHIVASDFVTDYGSGDVIAVKLVDKWDNPLAERIMSYSIGRDSYMRFTDSQGQIYIPTSLDVGVYDIDVEFKGNENYSDSQASMKLTVNKALLVIDDEISVNRDSAVIGVVLSKAIDDGIILTVDGTDYPLVLKNGVVSLSLNDLDFGLHNVTVRMVSDSYEAENLNDRFVISSVKTHIVASDLSTNYGSGDKLAVKLVDRYNNAVAGEIIHYTIDGADYSDFTDGNGTVYVDLNLDVGSHDVAIEFMGSERYINSSNSCRVVINTTIILPDRITYAQNAIYQVESDNSLTICINNVVYDSNSVSLKLNPGTYNVIVTNKQSGEVKNQSINVVSRITQNKDITMYYGAGTCYKVKVFDDGGNAAKGVRVTFKLNGNTYTRTSDNSGMASLKISLQPKTYTITATYKGVKVSNRIVVKSTLLLSNKVVKRSTVFKYNVKLLNSKGKILKNKIVTVKFRGKTYKARTNAKGIAGFKIKSLSKTGKFKLTAIYGTLKVSKVVTVKK